MIEPVTASTWDEVWAAYPRGTRYWSHSRFEDYTCPHRYKLRRIDKVPEAVSPVLYKGRLAHAVILAYTRHLLQTGQATDVTAIDDIARSVFFGEKHGLVMEDYAEILELARLHAESFVLPPSIVAAEEIWGIPVSERDVMLLVLDQLVIDGTEAIVTDYKTDWHLRSQREVERDVQLRYYAWATLQMFPQIEQVRCVMRFVRHQRDREVVYTPDDVAGVGDEIRAQIDRITSDTTFAPQPGAACQRCGYWSLCPAAPRFHDIVRIAHPSDAERVAGEIAVLERQIEVRKEALREWTAVAGPVVVNGIEWGHIRSEAVGVDDVREFVARLGDAALGYLSVDARKLRAMPEEERALIEDLLVDRSRTSFRQRRHKEGEADADPAGAA